MNPYQAFLDTILQQGLEEGCFPSGCGAIGRGRQLLAQTCVGRVPLPDGQPADEHTLYDMASMSKILGPTMLALKAVENGEIRLQDHLSDYVLFYRGGIPLHKRYQQIYKTFICVCGYLAFCICVCICGFCGLEIIHSFLLWKCLKPDKRYVVACVGAGAAAGSGQPQDKAECGKNIACHTYLCHQFPERLELRCQLVHFGIWDKPRQI